MPNLHVTTLPHCPENDRLRDFLLGKLRPDEIEIYENHISKCERCEDTIRGINANDTFSEIAGIAFSDLSKEDIVEQSHVDRLIDRLKLTGELEAHQNSQIARQHLEDRAAEVNRLLTPSDRNDTPGETAIGRLAHYKIIRLLGAGSTGVVYQALDQPLKRLVALKVLRPSLGSAARQRFMQEAQLSASIHHPHVVTIHQVGEEDALAYMAMQWIPGETLEDRLQNQSVMTESSARIFGKQISAGLVAAHAKNLIHRDIKPANIWLAEPDDQAIILDFGLARISDDDPLMTSTGMLAGTPNYMSPEQTRGLELDGRSDLFSLGCVLYRATTGKLPFGSTGILATLQSIQNDHPRPPHEINPNLSGEFSSLVMCLLEKQPGNRIQNADELNRAFDTNNARWKIPAVDSTKHQPARAKTNTQSSWIRWAALSTAIGLLCWGGYAFAPELIRIATDSGELVIETNDNDVEVQILKNGEQVAIVDTKTQQRIDIKSGVYDIQVSGDQNAFRISPERVSMTRGEREIVSIQRIENGASVVSGDKSNVRNMADTESPRYKGRTFDEWMQELKWERDLEVIVDGLNGLTELSKNSPHKRDSMIEEIITPLMREYGSGVLNTSHSSKIIPALLASFRNCSPDQIIRFVQNEIAIGTVQSRQALSWFGDASNFVAQDYIIVNDAYPFFEEYRIALIENLPFLIEKLFTAASMEIQSSNRKKGPTDAEWIVNVCANIWRSVSRSPAVQVESPEANLPTIDALNTRTDEFRHVIIAAKYSYEKGRIQPDSAIDFLTTYMLLQTEPTLEIVSHAQQILLNNERSVQTRLDFMHALEGLDQRFKPAVVESLKKLEQQNDPELNLAFQSGRSGTGAAELRDHIHKFLGKLNMSSDELIGNDGSRSIVTPPSEVLIGPIANFSIQEAKEPIYQDKTFDQWVQLLKRERSILALSEGIEAITVLSADDPPLQERMIAEVTTPLLRRYGGINIGTTEEKNLVLLLVDAFRNIPPSLAVDFIIREIEWGTEKSRAVFVFFFYPASNVYDTRESILKFRSAILEQFPEIVRALLRYQKRLIVSTNPNSGDRNFQKEIAIFEKALRSIGPQAITLPAFGGEEPDQPTIDLNSASTSDLRMFLKSELAGTDEEAKTADGTAEYRTLILYMLMRLNPDAETIAQAGEIMLDPNVPVEMRLILFSTFEKLDLEIGKLAKSVLSKLYEQNDPDLASHGFGEPLHTEEGGQSDATPFRNRIIEALDRFGVSTEGTEKDE